MIFYFDVFYLRITVTLTKNINIVYIFKWRVTIRVTPQGQCASVKPVIVRLGLSRFQLCNWKHSSKPHKWGRERYIRVFPELWKRPVSYSYERLFTGEILMGSSWSFHCPPSPAFPQAGTCPIKPPPEKKLNCKPTVLVSSLCLLIRKMELT